MALSFQNLTMKRSERDAAQDMASRQESATDFIRFIWYIMEMTGCSYFVLQCRSGFWGLTSFSKADPFTGLGPFNGLGLFNLKKILRRLYDASNNSNRFK